MFPHHSFKVNILFLLLLICSSVFSHPIENRSTYPFDASISVSGQSVYLSDYSDEFDTPVRLSLRCNDPSIGSIQVKLVVGIRSGAFSCQSHSYAVTAPITMGFGDSYTLSSAEVASYYKLQNLQYTGLVSGRIPEGVAEFTVQVQEYHSGAKLSNTAFTVRSLKLLSPPRLQSPTNGREVSFIQSSNLLFTWSGGGSTLPMQTIGYEFILKEIADTLAAPETAFNYSPVVYTEHTHLSSLIYSVDKPTLQEGKTYGWCVRAYVDKAGATQSATSYFTNAGYSEIFTFTVKDTEQQTTAPVTATAKSTEEDNPNCGVAPTIDISNTTPIETLQVGDTIMAGDFPIVLLEVSGMGGSFSGKGSVEIPYISHALRFAVEFENITVNTDKRLIDGKITGVRNQSLDNIANLDAIDYGATRPQEKAVVSADISLGVALPNAPPPTLQYNPSSGLLTFYDATGSVIAETTLNNPQGAKVFPITVKDEQGNLYQVNETLNSDSTTVHTLTPLGKQEGELPYKSFNPDAIDAYAAVVEFSPAGSAYSFDTYQDYYKDIALIYKQNTLEATLRYPYLGNDYYTPWQFVPLGKQVTLSAKIKINDKKAGIDPSKVIFRTDEGLVIASEYNEKDKSYRITVPSASAEGYYFLHALYKVGDGNYLHLGQVGIDTHRPIRARVVLVDMGGVYQQEQLAQSLNTITQAVGLTWQVDRINGFEVSKELTEQLFDKDSHELFSYNDVQKALNIALKSHLADKYDASACYVFMFDKAPVKGDRNIIGFMPRGGQYGYVHCSKLSSEELATILAHELMHGQFLLRHTFDDKYKAGLKEGINPQNLMDYKGGTHIAKWQWDQIYDPAITTSLIKYDEEGEWTTDGHYYTVQLIALMMGLDEETALKLGQASEDPDTKVLSNEFMIEKYTWATPVLQQKYHARTGGYHGVELAITAYALLKTHTDDESLEFLLHRLGDCFAHFDIAHDKEELTKNVSLQQYVDAIERYLNENIPVHLHKDWIEFMLVAKHGSLFSVERSAKEVFYGILTGMPVEKTHLVLTKIETLRKNTSNDVFGKLTNFLLSSMGDGISFFGELWKDICYHALKICNSEDLNLILGYMKELGSEFKPKFHKDIVDFMLSKNSKKVISKMRTYEQMRDDLLIYLPSANQNNFKMYGEVQNYCFTMGHADDKTPDHIVERKQIFLLYIESIIDYISLRYQTNGVYSKQEIIDRFSAIIDVLAEKPNARLDAVFAYESEKMKNISINKTPIVINSYLISITSFPNIKDGLRHYLNKIDKNLDVKSENVLNYYKFTIYTK